MVKVELEFLEFLFFNTFSNDTDIKEVESRISKEQAIILLEINDDNFKEVLTRNSKIYNEILRISKL